MDSALQNMKKAVESVEMKTIGFFMIAMIVVSVISVIIYFKQLKQLSVDKILAQFKPTKITSFKPNKTLKKGDEPFKLYDYYVKSSYNSCASSDFSNSYVDLRALNNVIKNGARFLDFEVYSMNKMKPVIAVSNDPSIHVKQSFNHLEFDAVMEEIKNNAFTSESGCPNPGDIIFTLPC